MVGNLLGHYEILAPLGRGGMGEVFQAHDTVLRRDVAIKLLPEELATDPERLARLEREAHLLAALNHPNVASIHSLEEVEDVRFLVLELVEGETLKERLDRGALELEEGLRVGRQVAAALEAAHEKGIVHRDLKPSNVKITPTGQVKVLDFGLAKAVQPGGTGPAGDGDPSRLPTATLESTRTGRILGTAAYMSPEQARGQAIDERTDVFSFGCLLYEMLSGRRAFARGSLADTLSAILEHDPDWEALPPDTPAPVRSLLGRCLQKDPEQRLHDVADARIEMDEILESGADRPVLSPSSPRRRGWLVPLLSLLAIGLFTIVLSLSGYLSVSAVPFEERDWILITDLENQTGEEVFDESLQTALTVSIDQSRYVNVLPESRIQSTLKRMRREPVATVDESTGREIAQREGIEVVLVPSISRLGNAYVLSAVLQDARTGESLRSRVVRADHQDEVLDALDELTRRIRQDLGETAASIQEQGMPLADVTTTSLEALKQYSVGSDMLAASRFQDARTHYELALGADPDFTAAKASLGMLHVDQVRTGQPGFDAEEGKRLLEEAIQHVDDLTEKERHGILAFHAWAVEGDVDAAEAHYRARLTLYPDDHAARNNLGWLYQNTGRFEEAIAEYEEAIRIDPDFMLTYDGLAFIYTHHLADLDAAIDVAERQLARNQEHAGAYNTLGWVYLGKGEYELARERFEKAVEINPQATYWYRLAHAHRLLGEYGAALEALEGVARAAPEDDWIPYHQGVVYDLMGDEARARAAFEEFEAVPAGWVREHPDNVLSHLAMGLALARLEDAEGAQASLERTLELDPSAHFEHAQLAAVLGMEQRALDALEEAIEAGFTNLVWMKIHPDFVGLYDEPRFEELWREGLSETTDLAEPAAGTP